MADLVYRGVAHDGISTPATQGTWQMIYRGVRHDGLPARTPAIGRQVAMIWRGVRHGGAGAGLRAGTTYRQDVDVPVPQGA